MKVRARYEPIADDASRAHGDQLIAWLREYGERRINSRLIDERRTVPPLTDRHADITLADVNASLPLNTFASIARVPGLAGDASIQFRELRLRDRLPVAEKSTGRTPVRQRGQPDRGVSPLLR